MTEIMEGAPAPDFNLETSDGPVTLADFAGKTGDTISLKPDAGRLHRFDASGKALGL